MAAPHTEFDNVLIHTAKCHICEHRNKAVLRRCKTCSWSICTPCYEQRGGNATHGPRMAQDITTSLTVSTPQVPSIAATRSISPSIAMDTSRSTTTPQNTDAVVTAGGIESSVGTRFSQGRSRQQQSVSSTARSKAKGKPRAKSPSSDEEDGLCDVTPSSRKTRRATRRPVTYAEPTASEDEGLFVEEPPRPVDTGGCQVRSQVSNASSTHGRRELEPIVQSDLLQHDAGCFGAPPPGGFRPDIPIATARRLSAEQRQSAFSMIRPITHPSDTQPTGQRPWTFSMMYPGIHPSDPGPWIPVSEDSRHRSDKNDNARTEALRRRFCQAQGQTQSQPAASGVTEETLAQMSEPTLEERLRELQGRQDEELHQPNFPGVIQTLDQRRSNAAIQQHATFSDRRCALTAINKSHIPVQQQHTGSTSTRNNLLTLSSSSSSPSRNSATRPARRDTATQTETLCRAASLDPYHTEDRLPRTAVSTGNYTTTSPVNDSGQLVGEAAYVSGIEMAHSVAERRPPIMSIASLLTSSNRCRRSTEHGPSSSSGHSFHMSSSPAAGHNKRRKLSRTQPELKNRESDAFDGPSEC